MENINKKEIEEVGKKVIEKEGSFDQYVEAEIPQKDRQHWLPVALIWIGCMICVPSILVGQTLISGLTFPMALLAGAIGYLLVLVITVLQGSQSSDLGRPTVVVAKPSFGSGNANYLFSFIITISLIGWYGVQATIAGDSFDKLLAMIGLNIGPTPATIIISAFMLASAVYGFKAMEKLNAIAVPLLIIVLAWATINVFMSADLSVLTTYTPTNKLSFISAVSIVFGSFIVGAVIAGDFTRYNKNRKETLKSAAIGIAPVGFLLVMIGALLAITSKDINSNIIETLTDHIPIPAIALITLIMATWTTNVSNAYSAGISLVNGLKLKDNKRPLVTLIAGAIGTFLAVIGILNSFQLFLIVLTTLVTPIAGVMIADYWILNKGKKEGYMDQKASTWVGITAWVLGSIPGLLNLFPGLLPSMLSENSVFMSILSICGIFVAMIFYLIFKGGKKYD